MSVRAVRLAPVFRSATQLGVLTATYLEPGTRFSIPELVERVGRPQPTIAREVDRLVESGWLETELRSGRRSVWADPDSLVLPELQGLLLKTVGPKPVLERELAGLAGLSCAYVYGSWAARDAGEPGPLPHDVDLLVIGDVDVADARKRADLASETLRRDVNVSVVSDAEWDSPGSGFLRHVKASPLVLLVVPVDP